MQRLIVIALVLAGCNNEAPTPQTDTPPVRNLMAEQLQKAQRANACITAASLANAVEMARLQTGKCPGSVQQLADENIIRSMEPDPWGGAYTLACTPALIVRSPGPDNKPDTDDDIIWGGAQATCEGSGP